MKHCNWLQIMDNVVDPVHESFLHARVSNVQFTDVEGRPMEGLKDVGEFDVMETPVGLNCFQTRRVGEDIWSRAIEWVIPNIAQIPDPRALPPEYVNGQEMLCALPRIFRWRVPKNDTETSGVHLRSGAGRRGGRVHEEPGVCGCGPARWTGPVL